MFAGVPTMVTTLLLLTAQWIGVVGLSKSGRSGEWWSMLTGTILTSLASVARITVLQFIGTQVAGRSTEWMMVYTAASFFSVFGGLLFMGGFAIHGLRVSRIRARVEELEMMNLAQATELERLRNR